jgi:hypothetical protein
MPEDRFHQFSHPSDDNWPGSLIMVGAALVCLAAGFLFGIGQALAHHLIP